VRRLQPRVPVHLAEVEAEVAGVLFYGRLEIVIACR
jgi:hypothetical protein